MTSFFIKQKTQDIQQALCKKKAANRKLQKLSKRYLTILQSLLTNPQFTFRPHTATKTNLGAKRIVYISCNPSTQARDAATLVDQGYTFQKFSLVDQFPHTGHIEAVGMFVK